VANPSAFGVLSSGPVGIELEEKPANPKGNLAVTGLYVMDGSASARAKTLSPSSRGEVEIVDLLKIYALEGKLSFTELARGTVWLDAGTPQGLSEASEFVRVLQERQTRKLSCPEEIAFNNGWITEPQLLRTISQTPAGSYRTYLESLTLTRT
jgi:glucose-1-phosphate thymidylyltransferase